MVERIRRILEAKQLTPTQFADVIGIARPIVSHILSGRNKPSLEVVQKVIAAFPDIALPWLLTGAGSMLSLPPDVSDSGPAAGGSIAPPKKPSVKGPKTPLQAQQGLSFDAKEQPSVVASPNSGFALAASVTIPAISEGVPAERLQAIPQPVSAPSDMSAVVAQAAVGASATASSPPAEAAIQPPAALPVLPVSEKSIRRIVIFYQDGTFTDYRPES